MSGSEFPKPSAKEAQEAQALANALSRRERTSSPAMREDARDEHRGDGDVEANALADFARDLNVAWSPSSLDAASNKTLVARALARAPKKRSSNVVLLFGAAGLAAGIAAAAAFVLLLSKAGDTSVADLAARVPPSAYVTSASTEALFHEPYGSVRSSDRIDRIATRRASDLRENRFRAWGLR